VVRQAFHRDEVVYYAPSEYLPPLDTGGTRKPLPQKGEPAYAQQPIISVPPEADNRNQTIVTPSDVKLNQDVPMPNIVAWSQTKAQARGAARFHDGSGGKFKIAVALGRCGCSSG